MLATSPSEMSKPSQPASHPRGIYTLFLTEMWERMSFYGIKVLLVLYMVDKSRGGKGFSDEEAVAIFGLYSALVYISALPGGWVGDRLLGAKRSVWWGGVVIALGHVLLALEHDAPFYSGLILIALGSGLLKPNISVMVAELYPDGGGRRDAGFTLLYMGINLGTLIGQVVCSNLGEHWGWKWGFSAAAAGMFLGLLQFKLSRRHIAEIGLWQPHPGQNVRRDWMLLISALATTALLTGLCATGVVTFDAVLVAGYASLAIVAIAVLFFGWVFLYAGLTAVESKRMGVNVILFVAAVLFFAGFAQGATSFTLFAERYTIREFTGFTLAAGMFQALNPIMVVIFSPLLVLLWGALAKRNSEPLLATKFAAGLMLLATGFLVASMASERALADGPVWPLWLVTVYFFITLGELCISPVGLSAVTKLAPQRLASRMMGVWFLAASLGYLLSGILAGKVSGKLVSQMPERFFSVFVVIGIIGIILLLCGRWIQRLMPGIK